jgi:glutamate 5-kinase
MTRKSTPFSTSSLAYKRLVAKIGTSVIAPEGQRLDMDTLSSLVEQVARVKTLGAKVTIVSSGAIASGRHVLGIGRNEKRIPFRQVLAAVGQSHLMHTYQQLFSAHGLTVAQALLTRHDLSDRQGYLNVRNTLLALFDLGLVPIVNENEVVAVEEIGAVFGDNDSLSAQVANLVDADLLAILTDIDGLYTADPHLDPQARLIGHVDRVDEVIKSLAGAHHAPWSRGGMSTKLEAARLATASGVATVICNGREMNVVVRLAAGEKIGTFFAPTTTVLESRKRWMLSGLSVRGDVVVDAGAAEAIATRHSSLLPAGVREVRGDFQRGDIVNIVSI